MPDRCGAWASRLFVDHSEFAQLCVSETGSVSIRSASRERRFFARDVPRLLRYANARVNRLGYSLSLRSDSRGNAWLLDENSGSLVAISKKGTSCLVQAASGRIESWMDDVRDSLVVIRPDSPMTLREYDSTCAQTTVALRFRPIALVATDFGFYAAGVDASKQHFVAAIDLGDFRGERDFPKHLAYVSATPVSLLVDRRRHRLVVLEIDLSSNTSSVAIIARQKLRIEAPFPVSALSPAMIDDDGNVWISALGLHCYVKATPS
jgi:hypothetical protein